MEQPAASSGDGNRGAGPEVGDFVEVANRFTGSWSRGFVVVGVQQQTYGLLRLSDGHVLPTTFSAHELRPDHGRHDTRRAGAA